MKTDAHPALTIIAQALEAARGQRIWVAGHLRPDGDCIGSQVGLVRVLRALGYDAVAINGDPVPQNLRDLVQDTPFVHEVPADQTPAAGVTITVDCSGRSRIGEKLSRALPPSLLNIDHHISNPGDAAFNWIDAESPATGAILAEIFFAAGYPVDAITANALYAGIATDTGQFRFPNTRGEVFELVARLCEAGAEPARVAAAIYEQESFARLHLLQRFLHSLELSADGKVCLGVVTQKDFSETGALTEDSEGLVDYARSLAGVAIGVYLEDRGNFIKGSFRAKEEKYRVDQIAAQFNGGGHACAAGFRVEEPLETFLPRLREVLARRIQELN
jgi:phosphoesterase RecJ-like protein